MNSHDSHTISLIILYPYYLYAVSQEPDKPATSYSVTRFSKKFVWSAFNIHSNHDSGFSFTLNVVFNPNCNNLLSVIYLIYCLTSSADNPSISPRLYVSQ